MGIPWGGTVTSCHGTRQKSFLWTSLRNYFIVVLTFTSHFAKCVYVELNNFGNHTASVHIHL